MRDYSHNDMLQRAAQLYLESPEAQHGDEEIALFEAELWWRLFAEAREEVPSGDE